MGSFTKVRSGISGLKKERDEIKSNYDFLSSEIKKSVESNASGIKALYEKSESSREGMAALGERLAKTDSEIAAARDSLSSDINALNKRLEGHRKTMAALGERLQRVSDVASSSAKVLTERGSYEKALSKGVQELGSTVSGLTEKIAAMGSSFEERTSSFEGKLAAGLSLVKKESEKQSSVIKDHDSVLRRMALETQSMKKDISAEDESISRVRESAEKNSRKLEALGTLESKIKHIEDVKSGLVKGVESLKEIRSQMAALNQKTRDLDSRLTGSDKLLDSKITEKAGVLDSQIQEKAGAMESQMQERLKSLESSINERGRTLEAKISADMQAMERAMGRAGSELKKLSGGLQKASSDLKELRASSSGLAKEDSENKRDIAALTARLHSLEALQGRVTEIEEAKDTVIAGISSLDEVREKLGLLSEKEKAFEGRVSSDVASLKADVRKAKASLSKIDLSIAGIRKDVERSISSDIASLRAQAKKNTADVSGITTDLSAMKSSLQEKIPADISALVASSTKNASDVGRINLSLAAMKKDISSAGMALSDLKASHASEKKRLAGFEGLRQKIGGVEKLGNTLSSGIEELRPLSGDIAALRKEISSVKAGLENAETVLEDKLKYNVAAIRKDAAFSSASIAKLDEGSRKLSLDFQALSKDLKALQSEAKTKDISIEDKVRTGVSGLKGEVSENKKALDSLSAEMKSLSLGIASLKKDTAAEGRGLSRLRQDLSALMKKSQEMEKLQVRLSEMDEAKQALTEAMEAKLEDKMQFIHTVMKQKEDNVEADLAEKAGELEGRISKEISEVKKAVSSKGRAIEGIKTRLSSVGKLEERLKAIDQQKDVIARNVTSLQDMRAGFSKMDEKARAMDKDMRALRAEAEAGFSELRRQVEASKTERRDKFGTAVKAFLNAKADLANKVNAVGLRISEANKRLDELSRLTSRIDLLERKVDRLTEKGSDMRRDLDSVGKKDTSSEKVMVVDLDKEEL